MNVAASFQFTSTSFATYGHFVGPRIARSPPPALRGSRRMATPPWAELQHFWEEEEYVREAREATKS